MGNTGSSSSGGRRRHGNRPNHPPPMQPETAPNRYVYAAATPYPSQYPNPNPNPPQYYQYPPELYRPPPPGTQMPPPLPYLPAPYDHHHRGAPAHPHWVGGRYPNGAVVLPSPPYVEHQKAVSIRNDINVKKESLRMVADEQNPGKFLVTFTFDATVDGCITIVFFAKEGEDCGLMPTKPDILPPMTVQFQQGLGQKYTQPSGTGIDLSAFEEAELLRSGDQDDIYPLAVKAEASSNESGSNNSQTTQATFKKEKGEYKLRVVKQILWVNGVRYELQEIYGIGNSVEADGTDPGKECVICLSEPRDTTVLPCRHMCMCSGCAKVLRFQTDKCPICRNPVERLLEIKVRDTDTPAAE